MEIYIAYGVVTAVILGSTFVFYTYKNWLPVRKNGIYIRILLLLSVLVLTDALLGSIRMHFLQEEVFLQVLSRIIMSVCCLLLFFHIFLYDLAITQKMRLTGTFYFKILWSLVVLTGVISILAPLFHFQWFYNQNQYDYTIWGNFLQILVLLLCLCAGIYLLIRSKAVLTRREYRVLLATHCLLLFDVNMQIVLNARNLASYFTLAVVVILYYILLHNSDQYVSFASRCFDRDGFNKVLRERAQYKEDFSCIGICINNIESITNFCDEAEIIQLHRKLGTILKDRCGRHNVYHIHSFEYMVVFRGLADVEKKHDFMKKEIPPFIRINNKNISIICGFYTLNFSDVEYDTTNFNRIITSMRESTMGQTDRGDLLYYRGENRRSIERDLEEMRVVNQCIAEKSFDFEIALIQSLSETKKMSCEFIMCKHMEDGTSISQERIWEIAAESGYLKISGYIMMEMLCRYIQENHWLEKQYERFHVNLTSTQLASTILAKMYIDLLKKYHIPGERICVEFTFDQKVDYDSLLESFEVFREYGISLLLDQFGVTVCNLKNVLNMPYDAVKVNHHMVRTFCQGDNHQLIYLVDMLKVKKWDVILDGVDDLAQIDMLRDMHVSSIQGQAITKQSAADALRKMEQSDGRCVSS